MTRRLQMMFLLALVGVLTCVGLVVGSLAGPTGAAGYAVLVLLALGLGAWRARGAATAAAREAASVGRTCGCCTSTVHDPVQVR